MSRRWSERQAQPFRDHEPPQVFQRVRAEQRELSIVAVTRSTWGSAGRALTEIRESRADEAVADGEVMVQERQRPIRRQCRQPQREPRELHRSGVAIDSVQTLLRD